MDTEAATIVGAVTAAISAVAVLLRTFGFNLTQDQENAIRAVVAIVAPLVVGLVARQFVWSKASVKAVVADAHAAGKVDAPKPKV